MAEYGKQRIWKHRKCVCIVAAIIVSTIAWGLQNASFAQMNTELGKG